MVFDYLMQNIAVDGCVATPMDGGTLLCCQTKKEGHSTVTLWSLMKWYVPGDSFVQHAILFSRAAILVVHCA